nr:hypothetical protein [[Eubacterium] cellulosolvens]
MKHIVVDLEMNSISRKSEARRICNLEPTRIGSTLGDLFDFSGFACA